MIKALIKAIKILLVCAFVIVGFSYRPAATVEADDSDFEENYSYYCELCSTKTKLTEAEKEVCARFRDYEIKRSNDIAKQIQEAQANISTMKANIASQGAKINQYNSLISTLESQIKAINNTISIIEKNIENLNAQIEEREIKIEQLNDQIKERMVASQLNVRTNSYIKFIMGASTFVDLLRRISAINEITAYDMGKIDEMEAEKVLLQNDINELQSQKDLLYTQQTELETKKQSYQKLLKVAQELMAEFRKQEAALEDEMEALKKDKSELEAHIEELTKALNELYASDGFGQFFKNTTFWISTEAYYYTSGGFHGALDAAVSIGTKLYPVANGVVVDIGTGCSATGGYMGNSCNWGRGNFVFYFCLIGDKYYFVQYDHLQNVNVKIGDIITQGVTVVGTTGNSGNSSGAHLHLAITYLGTTSTTSPEKILQQFKIYDKSFGLSNNISAACKNRGNKAPCIMNPNDIYGYRYGKTYRVY